MDCRRRNSRRGLHPREDARVDPNPATDSRGSRLLITVHLSRLPQQFRRGLVRVRGKEKSPLPWEHLIQSFKTTVDDTALIELENFRNERGRDGWQLAAAHSHGAIPNAGLVVFLKRPRPPK